MPLSPEDRKAELVRLGRTQQAIADACGENFTLVSHVIAGRRLTSPGSRKIMAYVAGVLGEPLETVFPEAIGRRRTDRKARA